ncbi:RCC1/BLIP-II protein [Mycena indigotica]|uniref:RCC1/BLIP-II protein n=1 Tax=Mycena indigotica TaxID=2126181 RepID=A0A8H6T2H7_9AGAR|nr:RCC1/BLIP-II protein [Mycena indigotica]KAF7309831.1 RCC1/BLIP-II protein [Mycena indigotica]
MTTLETLPVELFSDNLLLELPIESLLQLASTNKFFSSLCSDELLWQRRLKSDFNFSGAGTARTSGWKFIYRNMYNPKVFVWGEKANGRLGLGAKFPKSSLLGSGVPFPTRLRIPQARIVNIVAGGMSFHALDSEGRLWVWGTLNSLTAALNSEGFSEPGKVAHTPLRLDLPVRITEISCGRLHSLALDSQSQLWNWTSWGRPFLLSSRHITTDSKPVQVECGWNFSSILTKSGEIFVWWPLSSEMGDQIRDKNNEMDETKEFAARAAEGVIPCVPWSLDAPDLSRLPPLPRLPKLVETGDNAEYDQVKIVKIAAMDARLVALTDQGHVLLFRGLESEDTLADGAWSYLPNFSELNRVRTMPPFNGTQPVIAAPPTMKITHISAHFLKFFAYSTGASSIVLMGNTETQDNSPPHIEPTLQNRSVISVHVGDWHYAALTATGELLTWGGYSAGALGLGDPTELPVGGPGGFSTEQARLNALDRGLGNPPNTTLPTQVRFDHARKSPKDRFCFLACASGWHTGALVIDLQKDADDNKESEEEDEELVEIRPPTHVRLNPAPHLPIPGHGGIGGGVFRVGFAGRGLTRGGQARGPPTA